MSDTTTYKVWVHIEQVNESIDLYEDIGLPEELGHYATLENAQAHVKRLMGEHAQLVTFRITANEDSRESRAHVTDGLSRLMEGLTHTRWGVFSRAPDRFTVELVKTEEVKP